ncbi:MAG: iron-sulfur cluster carrier protein ApbC [Ignavibacterium sp.]|nr:MAG: iron-sulfur cluster carrier protein ApbC [Ignavibacterium sp.]
MADITQSEVLSVLKKVKVPNVKTDHLTLNSIKNFSLQEDALTFDLSVYTTDGNIEKDAYDKMADSIKAEFPSLKEIHMNVGASKPQVSTHNDPKKEEMLPGVKNTIAVASGKGGVGKSTVAVNLAVALAKDGAKVGLIDADIYGPSIPLMLGVQQKPRVFQTDNGMKMEPVESYGLKLISIGFLVDEKDPVIWRGPMASGAIKQFMTDVEWGELDYLVFDMPPGTGDIQLTLVQTIPLTGAVIVTTPQEVSLIDARKALRMFHRVNVPVLGIVENMSYFIAPDTGNRYDIFGAGGGQNLSNELDTNFLGGIPIDPRIREGGDKGIPIIYESPDTEEARSVTAIAHNITEQVNIRNAKGTSKVEISLGDD